MEGFMSDVIYPLMHLKLDSHYYVQFNDLFNTLDDVYKVVGVYSYGQVIDQEIDLYGKLFEHIGLPETELYTQLENYVVDTFYLLKQDNGVNEICAPASIIVDADIDVKKYYGTMLTVNLGLFEDPVALEPIVDIILNLLKVNLGNGEPIPIPGTDPVEYYDLEGIAGIDDINKFLDLYAAISVHTKEWLRTADYDKIVSTRRASKDTAKALAFNGCEMYKDLSDRYLQILNEKNNASSQVSALTAALDTTMTLVQETLDDATAFTDFINTLNTRLSDLAL